MRILVVSKRPDQYTSTWRQLSSRGVDLVFATNQAQAGREVEKGPPDAIIVDGGSMGSKGAGRRRQRVCSALRKRAPLAYLILIDEAAPGVPESRLIDVYLQPPFEGQALAGLLEQPRKAEDVIVSGAYRLSLSSRCLAGPFGEQRLSPLLCDLMACFMRHPGEVLTRQVLMREVWKTEYVGDTRTLDVHVSWLRKIVEAEPGRPAVIVTRRGAGYVFVAGG